MLHEKSQETCSGHTERQIATNDATTKQSMMDLSGDKCSNNVARKTESGQTPGHHGDEFYTKVVVGGTGVEATSGDGVAMVSSEKKESEKNTQVNTRRTAQEGMPPLRIVTQAESDNEDVIDENREHEDIASTPGNSPRDLFDLDVHEDMEPVWILGRDEEDYAAPGQGTVTVTGFRLPKPAKQRSLTTTKQCKH